MKSMARGVTMTAIALALPVGLGAQEVDRAALDSIRLRIEEVSRQQMEEVRRVQETRQAELEALRSALEAERSRITEAQASLIEAERALATAQGRPSMNSLDGPRSPTATTQIRAYATQQRSEPLQIVGNVGNLTTFPRFFTAGSLLPGTEVVSLNSELARYFEVESGALIVHVEEGTQAAQAGLLPGDVIVEVGGTRVTGTQDLGSAIRQLGIQQLTERLSTPDHVMAQLEEGVALRRSLAEQASRAEMETALENLRIQELVSGNVPPLQLEELVRGNVQQLQLETISRPGGTIPIPLRIVREGQSMEMILEP